MSEEQINPTPDDPSEDPQGGEFRLEPELTDGTEFVEHPNPAVELGGVENDLYADAPPPPVASMDDLNTDAPLPTHEEEELAAAQENKTVNRPAEGARQVMPGEVFATQDFRGSETAGDFLGLDTEFTAAQPELDLSDVPPPHLAAAGEMMQPEAVYEDDVEFAGDPLEGDEYFDEYLDESFDDAFEEDEQPASKVKLLAVALSVAIVAAGATVFAPRFLDKGPKPTTGGTTEIATGTKPPITTGPVTDPNPVDPTVDPAGTGEVDPLTDPVTTAMGEDPTGEDPLFDPIDLGIDPTVSGDPTTPDFGTDPLGTLLDPGTDVTMTLDPETAIAVGGESLGEPNDSFPSFEEGFEWVSADQLDMVWRGRTVPMEAISAPARTLMPRVGSVRVHMQSGDTIDGRLYAVGRQRVWIDVAPGRVGLDGEEVVRFEHLAVDAAASTASDRAPLSGERVRVKALGGIFYGRIMAQEGDTVTLQQDEGGKITLENAVIEPIGSGRAVIVQR